MTFGVEARTQRQPSLPWQCLNFLPDPHGQKALRLTFFHASGIAGIGCAIAARHRRLQALRWLALRRRRRRLLPRAGLHRLRLPDLDMREQLVICSCSRVSIASNMSKASRLYSFSGSRWP